MQGIFGPAVAGALMQVAAMMLLTAAYYFLAQHEYLKPPWPLTLCQTGTCCHSATPLVRLSFLLTAFGIALSKNHLITGTTLWARHLSRATHLEKDRFSAEAVTVQLSRAAIASVIEFLGYAEPTNSVTAYVDGQKRTVPVPLPKFRVREISTPANLFDGQTLILSGPATSTIQITKDKVPFTGDLPLVGGLFRSQTETSVKKSLIVFVTATIVDPAGNRVHTDDEMPFAKTSIPPQPTAPQMP